MTSINTPIARHSPRAQTTKLQTIRHQPSPAPPPDSKYSIQTFPFSAQETSPWQIVLDVLSPARVPTASSGHGTTVSVTQLQRDLAVIGRIPHLQHPRVQAHARPTPRAKHSPTGRGRAENRHRRTRSAHELFEIRQVESRSSPGLEQHGERLQRVRVVVYR